MGGRFVANTAVYGGAIVGDGIQRITNSSFMDNSTTAIGGAISSSASELSISNSTFTANNTVYSGGGLSLSSAVPASLLHLTLVDNTADEGGGIYIHPKEGTEPAAELHNSLIAGNEGGDCLAAFRHSSANLIEDGSCNPAISGDPKLGTLVEPEDGSPAYSRCCWIARLSTPPIPTIAPLPIRQAHRGREASPAISAR